MKEHVKPIILREGSYTDADVRALRERDDIRLIKDLFDDQSRELFEITHPSIRFAPDYAEKASLFVESRKKRKAFGDWILFPWNGTLLHTVNEEEYFQLRTNRNRNIITLDEQKRIYGFAIGVVGLSIGNAMAVTMAYTGIGKTMKITDFDTIETTNLNRIRSGIHRLGDSKLSITCEQVYEINPYADLVAFPTGLTKNIVDDYVFGEPKPKIIFEAIDDFEIKVRIRIAARKARIPLIMLTNLGDNLLIDIERYDLNPKNELFNGSVGNAVEEILSNPITEDDKKRYAVQLVGKENIPDRVFESVQKVGEMLAGRPQLMSTVTMGAGMAALLARKIALDESLPSGRRLITFGAVDSNH